MTDEHLGESSNQIIEEFFRNYDDINPYVTKIYFGKYFAYDPDQHQPRIIDTDQGIKLPFSFYLDFYTDPIPVQEKPGVDSTTTDEYWWPFQVDRSWKIGGPRKMMHLVEILRLADAAADSNSELEAMRFPLAGFFKDLSLDTREELYAKELWDIRELPMGMPAETGPSFLRTLAHTCTYDEKGKYWEKWRKGVHNKQPRLRYVSSVYLGRTVEELPLVKGFTYCMAQNPNRLILYRLQRSGARLERVIYYDSGELAPAKQKTKDSEEPVPHECWFFYAEDGLDKERPARSRLVAGALKDNPSFYRVADPQIMVEEALGKDAVGRLGLRDPYHWFVEMVANFFPQRFYPIDITNIKQDSKIFNYADAQMLKVSLDAEIRKAMTEDPNDEYGGVFTDEVRRRVPEWLRDPRWLVLPQGLKVGPTRFIGTYEGLAYMRDLDTGLVTVMPVPDFVNAVALGDFVSLVYKQTAWIIPFVTYGTFAILAVATLGTVGFTTGVSAAAVRQAAVNYARREISNAVIWEVTKKLGPAVAALLADLILALFPEDRDARKWRSFAKGFFHGYVYETLYDHLYKNVLGVVTRGPKEWRMAMTIKKLYRVLDELHEFLVKVQGELDKKSIEQALKNFDTGLRKLVTGAALLLSSVYYASHGETGGLLDILGKGEHPDGPSADEWDAEAAAVVSELAKAIVNGLLKADKIDDVLVSVKDSKLLKVGAVLFVLRRQILDVIKYTWDKRQKKGGVKKPTSWKRKLFFATAIAAVAVWAGSELDDMTEGKLIDTIVELIQEAISEFPGRDEGRAYTNGKVVGNLLGGFMLNRFLYKEAKPGDKLSKVRQVLQSPILGTTIKANLRYGIVTGVLKVVFKRYVALYDELVTKGIFGAARGEGIFARLIGDLYEQELTARGLGHLKKFESKSEKMVTLNDIVMTLLGLYRILDQDNRDFLEKKYAGDLAKYKADLEAFLRLSDATGLSDFVGSNLPVFYHQMTQHLRLAVHEMIEGILALLAPFKDGGYLSWVTLLAELGLDLGDVDKLQEEVQSSLGAELKDFKAKTD